MELIKAALLDAQNRLSVARAVLDAIKQEALTVNARGIDAEKVILGIEGEIKALSALDVTSGE
jgi:hypothetical protein